MCLDRPQAHALMFLTLSCNRPSSTPLGQRLSAISPADSHFSQIKWDLLTYCMLLKKQMYLTCQWQVENFIRGMCALQHSDYKESSKCLLRHYLLILSGSFCQPKKLLQKCLTNIYQLYRLNVLQWTLPSNCSSKG